MEGVNGFLNVSTPQKKQHVTWKIVENAAFLGDILVFQIVFLSDLVKCACLQQVAILANPTYVWGVWIIDPTPMLWFSIRETTITKIVKFGSSDLPPSSWVKLHNYLTHHTPQLSRTGPTSDATNITGSWFTEANHTARFSWPAREAWTFKIMRFYDACRKWMGWRLILREYDMIGFFRFMKTS